jgi:hypothetical protein
MVMGRNPDKLAELLPNHRDMIDDVKHLADALDLYAMARPEDAPERILIRTHAMKFYALANAPDSVVRVGQDVVDDFIGMRDFIGARGVMETNLLPILSSIKLAGRTIPVRSQYAVVLAYAGDFAAAEAEMARLAPYEPGLDLKGQGELRNQRKLIAELRRRGPPPQRIMPPSIRASRAAPMAPIMKPGRNDPCPCGSGLKFKKCHG